MNMAAMVDLPQFLIPVTALTARWPARSRSFET